MSTYEEDFILILLVENDPVDRMAFLRFVEHEALPYRCVTACSVKEAQQQLRQRRFDVVLADYSLDDGTAIDVLKYARDVPVVVVTGSGSEEVAASAMKAGASDYVIKDPAGNYLITMPLVVQNTIARKQAERELRQYRERLEALVDERTAELIAINRQLRSEIVERRRAEETLKEKVAELEALYRIGVAISSRLDTQAVLQLIVEQTAPLVNAASCSVLLPDADTGRLVFVAAVDGVVGLHVPFGRSIAARAMRLGVPQVVNDVLQDPDYYAAVGDEVGLSVESLLAVPLIAQGNAIGVLEAVNKREGGFTEHDRDLLVTLASHAAVILDNARMYEEQQKELARRIRAEEQLRAVHRLGIELTRLRNEKAILARMVDAVVTLFQFENVGYGLVDEAKRELVYYLKKGNGEPDQPLFSLPLDGERGVGVMVVRTGQAIRLNDVTQSRRYVPPPGETPRGSELCVPMRAGEQVIGVLNAESYEEGRFTATDEQTLQTLANQAAVAIENARLYKEAREQAKLLATVNAVGVAVTSSLETEVILRRLLEMTCRAVDAERGSFLWLDEKSGELIFALSLEEEQSSLGGQRLPPGQGIAGWVAKHGEAVIINDVAQDARYDGTAEQLTGVEVRSILCAPLQYRDRMLGVVEIVNKREAGFTERDLALLKAVSSAAASALENARLYEEQKRLLREQKQAQARLIQAEKMGALGRLTASITHEINNPLQAVQGCLALVGEELNADRRDEVVHRYLNIAEGEIQRVAEIVRRMRDFYRPSQEEMKLTDIRAVVESVLALSNKQLQHSRVTVRQEWEENLPLVRANPDHLKQVFLNLVLNAVDAMPGGGELSITGSLEQPAGDRKRPYLRIEFRDSGTGIDPEVLPRLFEPFFTTKENGSGLGLYISYGIIKAHRGRISASNVEEGGASFVILLPV